MASTTNNFTTQKNHDEIDLFDLCLSLWRYKWVIISMMMLGTIIATIITFWAIPPTYRSSATISPPEISLIDRLNQGVDSVSLSFTNAQSKTLESPHHLQPITAEEVFNVLLRVMQSNNFQKSFYTSAIQNKPIDIKPHLTPQINFDAFKKQLSILIDNASMNANLTLSTHNAKQAYELLSAFINEANQQTVYLILKNRESEINTLIDNLKFSLEVETEAIQNEYHAKLFALQEQLKMAQNLEVKLPKAVIHRPYEQGVIAISTQINQLKNAYQIPQSETYDQLLSALNEYEAITLPNISELNAYYMEASPNVATNASSPNKKLILAIGAFTGLIIGILFALIHLAIRRSLSLRAL